MVCLIAAGFLFVPAEVRVEPTNYKGWSDAFRITNGTVDVVVVPQIGRVMRYGYVEEPNILWENSALSGKTFPAGSAPYRNYGGDKIWPAPQKLWGWPPDQSVDGAPWSLEKIPNGVRLTSPEGKKPRIRFRREITLSPLGTEVTFLNRMENRGGRSELSLWQVTQLDDPDSVSIPVGITSQQPKGWVQLSAGRLDPAFYSVQRQSMIIKRAPRAVQKFGARSLTGELQAAKGSTRFTSVSRTFANVPYPDGGSAQEVFTSPDPDKYVELEHLGPLTRMERGEVVQSTVTWRLSKG